VEARVLEELLVVAESHEGVLRAAETRIGEGETETVEERIKAEDEEEREAGKEKQVRGQRPSSDRAPHSALSPSAGRDAAPPSPL